MSNVTVDDEKLSTAANYHPLQPVNFDNTHIVYASQNEFRIWLPIRNTLRPPK
jgi:hypothetical protein